MMKEEFLFLAFFEISRESLTKRLTSGTPSIRNFTPRSTQTRKKRLLLLSKNKILKMLAS